MKLLMSIVGILGLFLASCSPKVHSNLASGADFKNYKTYAWIRETDTSGTDQDQQFSAYNNQIIRNNVKNNINGELQSRGFTIDTVNPDFLVSLKAVFEKKTDLVGYPLYSSYYNFYYPGYYALYPGYYYSYPFAYDYYDYTYTEGTLVVDIIDRETKKLVWRGWSDEREIKPKKVEKELAKDVTEIFQEFPS
ncbi:MAG: DUF4136 domain-containing protein [Sporocytophaga sp.]|jgi:hypothetical protein|nr:DUF4136 domain-containing protein [Sporocytophaga sp.]